MPSYAFDLSYSEESPLMLLSEADWEILKSSARETLNNNENNQSTFWSNKETGNSGIITVLSSNKDDTSLCRYTQFIVRVGTKTSDTKVNLCKTSLDTWKEMSSRDTTITDNLKASPDSQNKSIMFQDNSSAAPTESMQKSLSQISEHCRQLARDIEDLKGKPIRRSATIDLHKAECLR